MDFKLDSLDVKELEDECKGKIYKAKVNAFIGSKGEYVYQEKMIPMKRLSCKGCEHCGFFDDDLNEMISCGNFPIVDEIENDSLYTLKVVNISHDWESGIIDGWDIAFVKIEE